MKGNTKIIGQQIECAIEALESSRTEIFKRFLYLKNVLEEELMALKQNGVSQNRFFCLEEATTLEDYEDFVEHVSREAVDHLISVLNEMINKRTLEQSRILEVDDGLYCIYYGDFIQEMEALSEDFAVIVESCKNLKQIQERLQKSDED